MPIYRITDAHGWSVIVSNAADLSDAVDQWRRRWAEACGVDTADVREARNVELLALDCDIIDPDGWRG